MPKTKFNIISVDGGGLKGLIAVKILESISAVIKKPLTDAFQLFAGTSTGGLIVSALCVQEQGRALYPLNYIEDLYLQVGESVLTKGSYNLPESETLKFDAMLRSTFKSAHVSETLRPLFVPAYDSTNKKIIVFKTRSALQDPSKDLLLLDVCRATSAIPPVFPPYPVMYKGQKIMCVDAGVHYLKNPALAALAEVWKHRDYYCPGAQEEDISLVSVSTGTFVSGRQKWSTDINTILWEQGVDMKYIREQQLHIDFNKLGFLRVDLNLGAYSFSVEQLVALINDITELQNDRGFSQEVKYLLH